MSIDTPQSQRWALLAFLLTLGLGSCQLNRTQRVEHALGFALPLGAEFSATTSANDEGWRVDFLCDDVMHAPRLLVYSRQQMGSLGDMLADSGTLWEGAELIRRTPQTETRGIACRGLGHRQWLRPFPEDLPELVILQDQRVFIAHDTAFIFAWQQEAADSLSLRKWDEWSAGIEFFPTEEAH
jgi:hypothetical protein